MITENHIKRACLNEQLLYKGRDISRHNGVKTLNVTREMGTYTVKGYVQAERGNMYYSSVEIEENEQIYGECECPGYHTYRGVCEHNVGLLYKFIQGMEEGTLRIRDLDEVYGKEVLQFYEESLMKELDDERKYYIRIEPKLYQVEEDVYALEISVGEERMYVVKNIIEFVDNILTGKEVNYGKKLSFVHTIETFSKESQEILALIIEQVVARQSIIGSLSGNNRWIQGDKKRLLLSVEGFDKLFNCYLDREMAYETESEKSTIRFINQNPVMHFVAEQINTQMIISIKNKRYNLLDYPIKKYILVDHTMYRCSEDYNKRVFPLLTFIKQVYPPQLKFDENGWKRFLMSVLPIIKKYMILDVKEELIKAYVPPQLTIRFYLDQDEQNRVIGNVEFDYEGYRINPYEQVGESHEHIKDILKEHQFNQLLERYGFKVRKGKLFIEEEEKCYTFLIEGVNQFVELSEVHVTDKLKKMVVSKPLISNIGIKVDGKLLQIDVGNIDLSVEEIEAILFAYKQKSKYYRIKDGRFIRLNTQSMDEFVGIIDGLGVSSQAIGKGAIEVPLYKSLYLDQILRGSKEINAIRDQYFKKIVRTVRNVEDTDFEVPKQLQKMIRSYQKTGFRWLKTMASYGFGAILADDMGLGKTLQVIAVLLSEKSKENTSIVVAPTSLVLNWEKELQKFAPELQVEVIHGMGQKRQEKLINIKEKDVLITSYDSLKRDLEYYQQMNFKFCIADEAHYIKNPTTQNAKVLKQLNSDIRFALTGTPIENSLSELWSLFDFIMPNYLFHYQHFKGKFETPIMRAEDSQAMKYLHKLIAPFILRRLKKEVLTELPDKIETVIYNKMEGEQELLYKANVAQMQKDLAKELEIRGLGRAHMKILAMLTRLRQLCCHPALYIEDYKGQSSKLIQCMELVEEAVQGKHRILIFSQFTTMLDQISHELSLRKLNYYKLTGRTKIEERLKMVESFNAGETDIFLISLKAGGTGLNLTGADVVIHYDPWWNVTSENQATDRAYRIGQEKKVQVFKLITENSIEEKIKQLQEKKIGLAENLLLEGGQMLNQMTDKEIKELFTVS